MTFILGISGYFHDSSICLLKDGELIEFLKEEEFTRIKGSKGFPIRILNHLIGKYELTNENVDLVVFYEKPLRGWTARTTQSLRTPKKSFKLLSSQLKEFWNGPIGFASKLRKNLKIPEDKIKYAPHHFSHALSAMTFADKDIAQKPMLHFVFDGVGDDNCQSIISTKSTNASIIFEEKFPNSLGLFYSTITDFCGFLVNEGEYKLMALAAFGKPVFADVMLNDMLQHDGHRIKLDLAWFDFLNTPERSFSDKFISEFGQPISLKKISSVEDAEFKRAANLASSAQVAIETVIYSIVEYGLNKFKCEGLTFTGGVAQNSLAMGNLVKKLPQNLPVIIPPSPGDSGAAIGAAYFGKMLKSEKPLSTNNIFFGKLSEKIQPSMLEMFFDCVSKPEKSEEFLDQLILDGHIVCTFFSGKEIGPRALCNRSIICAANNSKAVSDLNAKVKKREFFRPLAPVMLEEIAEKHFHILENSKTNYRWMALTTKARSKFPSEYMPALHKDKTARIQILEDREHFIYKTLVRLKGRVDMLINTSFNVAGDPIVHDLIDCYTNMQRLGVEYLITESGLFKLKASE